MIELTITTLSHAGEGIGREAGRAIFVPFALPGETVRVEIVEEKKNFARARLLEVIVPTPERITPRCPHHFSLETVHPVACGGCQLQQLDYPAQLKFKQQTVIEQLTRVGGIAQPPVRSTLPAPTPFNYRNHVQFSLTPEGQLGFRAASSHQIIPIHECHLLDPMLVELFPRLHFESRPELERVTLRAGAEAEALIIFESDEDAPEVELDLPASVALLHSEGTTLTLAGSDYILQTVRDRPFKVSAGSFFQVNTSMAEQLVELVLNGLALTGGETVLDLYCGVGLFSAFIAPVAGRVIGIEAFTPAVNDAAVNLDEFENIEIYEAQAETVLPALQMKFDAVVLDPPRSGCAPEVVAALVTRGAARLVYVSCDPATLARDAKRLVAGGYRLEWVQPLDLFPQTYHIECVAKFVRG